MEAATVPDPAFLENIAVQDLGWGIQGFTEPYARAYARPVSEWIHDEKALLTSLSSVSNSKNIEGLECNRLGPKITYQGSEFGKFHTMLKVTYKHALEHPTMASILTVFQSDFAEICPYYINHRYESIQDIHAVISEKGKELSRESYIDSLFRDVYTDDILLNTSERTRQYIQPFQGNSYRREIQRLERLLENTQKEYAKKAEESYWGFEGESDYKETIQDTHAKLQSYMPHYLISQQFELADAGKPVCMIHLVSDYRNRKSPLQHAIAGILVKRRSQYFLYLYDPMFYIREADDYIWALETAYIDWKLISKRLGLTLHIRNLSEYCHVNPNTKQQTCVQYRMDAEYCLMFSTYFVFCFLKHKPHLEDGKAVRRLITETYMTEHPENLSRAPCKTTNIFRIRMMSFLLTTFLSYSLPSEYEFKRILSLETVLREKMNVSLFPAHSKSFQTLLRNLHAFYVTPSTGGGKRRVTRRRRSQSSRR